MTMVIECHPAVVVKQPGVDLNAIKTKQQAAWSSGDYAVIGTTLQIVGERLAEAMDLVRAGKTVLDEPPATATSRLRPPGVGARSRLQTPSNLCSSSAASAPKRKGFRSNSRRLTPRICRSPMRPSPPSSQRSVGCSAPIRTALLLKWCVCPQVPWNDRSRQLDARRLHRTNV